MRSYGKFKIGDRVKDHKGNVSVVENVGSIPFMGSPSERIYQLSDGRTRAEHQLNLKEA